MLVSFIAAALSLGQASAGMPSLEIASGDWRDIPVVKSRGRHRMSTEAVSRIEEAVEAGKCPAAGNERAIDLNVPFMLHYSPRGELQRIVVSRIGCPEVESILGQSVLSLARAGEYQPTGENEAGWYRSELSFYLER